MNRFTIDEDAALELIGVGHLSEAIVEKRKTFKMERRTLNYLTNGTWRMKDYDYDNGIIDDAIEKTSIDEEDTHLIVAADFSFYSKNSLKKV